MSSIKRYARGKVFREVSLLAKDSSLCFYVLNYVYRFLQVQVSIEREFFECLSFALSGLEDLNNDLQSNLQSRIKQGSKTEDFQEHENNIITNRMISISDAKEVVNDLKSRNRFSLPCVFEDILENNKKLIKPVMSLALYHCEKELKKQATSTANRPYRDKFKNISEYFYCSPTTIKLLEFAYVLYAEKSARNFFDGMLDIREKTNQSLLCHLLDITQEEYTVSVEQAQLCGLLEEYDRDDLRLTEIALKLIQSSSKKAIDSMFYTRLKSDIIPLDMFKLEEEQKDYICRLLQLKSEKPVHILLYGEPGTGKTCFANSIANELGFDAWSVVSREDDSDNCRRSSLVACRHLMSERQNTLIVLDEAERLLDTNRHSYGRSKDKAWLNTFLEKPNTKMIWISNEVDEIDQAVRRRFSYSVQFKTLTKEQRIVMWQEIIKKERVTRYFKANELEKLVDEYDIPVALISGAIQQTKLLDYKNSEFISGIRNYLDAYITLANDGLELAKDLAKEAEIQNGNSEYSLAGVSLEKDTADNLDTLISKLNKINKYLSEHKTIPPNAGTLLFYGPPGTGKSALAKHIAKELGRKCVIKRTSDILSKFVGESEKNIRNIFETAEKEGVVLVIDEADSFIFSRDSARTSWEVTAVNEFLTALESFKGICICTTNRHENMDSAAMRRFAFKLGFTYAKESQVFALYESVLAPLLTKPVAKKMPDDIRKQLLACKFLTAGDFAAVRSQFWLYEKHELSHKDFVDALVKEQKLKLDTQTKKMGF